MKKQPVSYVFYIGILIFVVGMFLKYVIPETDGSLQMLPFVLSGFGAGFTGVGIVNILRKKRLERDPEKAKQYEIEENDERNIHIREKAASATWYISLFILAILTITFLMLDYIVPSFITLAALFIHIISLFVYIYIYNKKL